MGDSLDAMVALKRYRRERRQANGQMEVVGGGTNLQVSVRGETFDLLVNCGREGWEWQARGTYTNEQVAGTEKTWLEAQRAAFRAASGMAPFSKKGRGA